MAIDLMDRVADMRLEAEALLLEMTVMYWRSHEYGEPVNFKQVMKGHERLASADTVRMLKRAVGRCGDPEEKRALGYFLNFAIGLFIEEKTAAESDRLTNAIMRAKVRLAGKSVPYRALASILSNEPGRARRRTIHSLAMGVVRRLNPQYANLWKIQQRLPRELGYSYVRMSEAERQVNLRKTAGLARDVLKKTKSLYTRLLDEQSRAILGYGADGVRRADIAHLLKNASVDKYFPAKELVATAKRTASGLGFDLDRMPNLRIFDADRPNKAPRAMCCSPKTPGDVRISVRPIGGASDYETLLHELGHGLHFAMSRTDRFEYQQLGGAVVTETYAFLLEHLMDSREWLAGHSAMLDEEVRAFLRYRAFLKLYWMRRYAAKILYEIHFHSGRKKPREAYRRLLSDAYCFPLSQEDSAAYLSDIDSTFYSADYFRAWMLEAALAETLETRHGPKWFTRKGAGKFLAGLWESGNRMMGADMLAVLGKRDYSVATWLRRVRVLL